MMSFKQGLLYLKRSPWLQEIVFVKTSTFMGKRNFAAFVTCIDSYKLLFPLYRRSYFFSYLCNIDLNKIRICTQ